MGTGKLWRGNPVLDYMLVLQQYTEVPKNHNIFCHDTNIDTLTRYHGTKILSKKKDIVSDSS